MCRECWKPFSHMMQWQILFVCEKLAYFSQILLSNQTHKVWSDSQIGIAFKSICLFLPSYHATKVTHYFGEVCSLKVLLILPNGYQMARENLLLIRVRQDLGLCTFKVFSTYASTTGLSNHLVPDLRLYCCFCMVRQSAGAGRMCCGFV